MAQHEVGGHQEGVTELEAGRPVGAESDARVDPRVGFFSGLNPGDGQRDGDGGGGAVGHTDQRGARGGVERLLFEQRVIEHNFGVGPNGLLAVATSCVFRATAADDFTLDGAAMLARIEWEGVYFGAAFDNPGPDLDFRITLYEDSGAGNVGAIVADIGSFTLTKSLHPRDPLLAVAPVYTYSAELDEPIALAGGVRYWLSINVNPSGPFGPSFGWAVSDDGNAADTLETDQPLQNQSVACLELPTGTFIPGGSVGLDADLAFRLFAQCAADDCNCNGTPDADELASGAAADCNDNGIPDDCDVLLGLATDCDGDGILDLCQSEVSYSDSAEHDGPFGTGAAATLSFASPPLAGSDVAVTIDVRGDFNAADETLRVLLNGEDLGFFLIENGRDCPAAAQQIELTLSEAEYNALVKGTDAVFVLAPSSQVRVDFCNEETLARVSIAYDLLNTTDCNKNGVFDACDITAGTSLDCNGDGVPDECQLDALFIETSPLMGPVDGAQDLEYVVQGAPGAMGVVHLFFSARADLSAQFEYIDVYANNVFVGSVFVSGANDCPGQPDTDQLNIDPVAFNALLEEDLRFRLDPTAPVGGDLCENGGSIEFSLQYDADGGFDCNFNGILDSCEIKNPDFDLNGNSIPDDCETLGDINGDGVVNSADMAALLGAWASDDSVSDLNHDGVVNALDLAFLLSLFT